MTDLNKLISLTFDEDPEVRIKAAAALENIDDPAAVFALIELSYDKEPRVRKRAQESLEKKKKEEKEVLSFAELFSKGAKETQEKELPADKKEKLLSPITKMFERHLGKEKAERVKAKMMPTIERIYHSRTAPVSEETREEQGRKVIQEFLTGYLEAISDINQENNIDKHEGTHEERVGAEVIETLKKEEDLKIELESIGKPGGIDRISEDLIKIETEEAVESEEEKGIEKLPNTFFKKAYETMMISNGDDDVMRSEMERMLKEAEKDIKLAFRMAKKKFKEKRITNITKIRDGMRNINTELLEVKEVENIEYTKKKKEKAIATRIVVHDENGNEGVIYLFDGRGMPVKPGMKLKVIRGQARTFEFSGETALTIGKKGEVHIVL